MFKFSSAIVLAAFTLINTASATPPTPYAGQQQREIKALSTEEIESYLAGKGAGLAKAAELNHYPGPKHVLELADKLHLSDAQKSRTQAIFDAMQKEAVRQGKTLVEKEQELDRQFAAGAVTTDSLRSALKQIGELQAQVRGAHLAAHVEQQALLTKTQIATYDELRGYTSGNAAAHGDHSHQH